MTHQQFEANFWKHYLKYEKNLIQMFDYVEFEAANFSTYSSEFMRLLLSIGSEFDNALRAIYGFQDTERTTISNYASAVLSRYPNITSQKVCVKNRSIVLQPFSGWSVDKAAQSLDFWKAYNDVKHDRIKNYQMASLKNVVNALAALFIIEMFEYERFFNADATLLVNAPAEDESSLFYLGDWIMKIRDDVPVKHYYPVADGKGAIFVEKR